MADTTPATPTTRVRKPRFEAVPSGLTFQAPADGIIDGTVSAGYLRTLVRSIPARIPDSAPVKFTENSVTVGA